MGEHSFAKSGLYFDELYKIRVVEPDAALQTDELKTECKDFVEKISALSTISNDFIELANSLASEVEKCKMKAIGKRNMLKSVTKERESRRQQLQALILEKSTELERLRVQHQSLVRTEQEQQDLIQQLILNR